MSVCTNAVVYIDRVMRCCLEVRFSGDFLFLNADQCEILSCIDLNSHRSLYFLEIENNHFENLASKDDDYFGQSKFVKDIKFCKELEPIINLDLDKNLDLNKNTEGFNESKSVSFTSSSGTTKPIDDGKSFGNIFSQNQKVVDDNRTGCEESSGLVYPNVVICCNSFLDEYVSDELECVFKNACSFKTGMSSEIVTSSSFIQKNTNNPKSTDNYDFFTAGPNLTSNNFITSRSCDRSVFNLDNTHSFPSNEGTILKPEQRSDNPFDSKTPGERMIRIYYRPKPDFIHQVSTKSHEEVVCNFNPPLFLNLDVTYSHILVHSDTLHLISSSSQTKTRLNGLWYVGLHSIDLFVIGSFKSLEVYSEDKCLVFYSPVDMTIDRDLCEDVLLFFMHTSVYGCTLTNFAVVFSHFDFLFIHSNFFVISHFFLNSSFDSLFRLRVIFSYCFSSLLMMNVSLSRFLMFGVFFSLFYSFCILVFGENELLFFYKVFYDYVVNGDPVLLEDADTQCLNIRDPQLSLFLKGYHGRLGLNAKNIVLENSENNIFINTISKCCNGTRSQNGPVCRGYTCSENSCNKNAKFSEKPSIMTSHNFPFMFPGQFDLYVGSLKNLESSIEICQDFFQNTPKTKSIENKLRNDKVTIKTLKHNDLHSDFYPTLNINNTPVKANLTAKKSCISINNAVNPDISKIKHGFAKQIPDNPHTMNNGSAYREQNPNKKSNHLIRDSTPNSSGNVTDKLKVAEIRIPLKRRNDNVLVHKIKKDLLISHTCHAIFGLKLLQAFFKKTQQSYLYHFKKDYNINGNCNDADFIQNKESETTTARDRSTCSEDTNFLFAENSKSHHLNEVPLDQSSRFNYKNQHLDIKFINNRLDLHSKVSSRYRNLLPSFYENLIQTDTVVFLKRSTPSYVDLRALLTSVDLHAIKSFVVFQTLENNLSRAFLHRIISAIICKTKCESQTLLRIVKDCSGRDFTNFFNLYVFSDEIPNVRIDFDLDRRGRLDLTMTGSLSDLKVKIFEVEGSFEHKFVNNRVTFQCHMRVRKRKDLKEGGSKSGDTHRDTPLKESGESSVATISNEEVLKESHRDSYREHNKGQSTDSPDVSRSISNRESKKGSANDPFIEIHTSLDNDRTVQNGPASHQNEPEMLDSETENFNPLTYIRVDANNEHIAMFVVNQTDTMHIEQLLTNKSVPGQIDALNALRKSPSTAGVHAIERLINDTHCFHRVRVYALEVLCTMVAHLETFNDGNKKNIKSVFYEGDLGNMVSVETDKHNTNEVDEDFGQREISYCQASSDYHENLRKHLVYVKNEDVLYRDISYYGNPQGRTTSLRTSYNQDAHLQSRCVFYYQYAIQFFIRKFCLGGSTIPKPLDCSQIQNYLTKKGVVRALTHTKRYIDTQTGQTPYQTIKAFLLSALTYNSHDQGEHFNSLAPDMNNGETGNKEADYSWNNSNTPGDLRTPTAQQIYNASGAHYNINSDTINNNSGSFSNTKSNYASSYSYTYTLNGQPALNKMANDSYVSDILKSLLKILPNVKYKDRLQILKHTEHWRLKDLFFKSYQNIITVGLINCYTKLSFHNMIKINKKVLMRMVSDANFNNVREATLRCLVVHCYEIDVFAFLIRFFELCCPHLKMFLLKSFKTLIINIRKISTNNKAPIDITKKIQPHKFVKSKKIRSFQKSKQSEAFSCLQKDLLNLNTENSRKSSNYNPIDLNNFNQSACYPDYTFHSHSPNPCSLRNLNFSRFSKREIDLIERYRHLLASVPVFKILKSNITDEFLKNEIESILQALTQSPTNHCYAQVFQPDPLNLSNSENTTTLSNNENIKDQLTPPSKEKISIVDIEPVYKDEQFVIRFKLEYIVRFAIPTWMKLSNQGELDIKHIQSNESQVLGKDALSVDNFATQECLGYKHEIASMVNKDCETREDTVDQSNITNSLLSTNDSHSFDNNLENNYNRAKISINPPPFLTNNSPVSLHPIDSKNDSIYKLRFRREFVYSLRIDLFIQNFIYELIKFEQKIQEFHKSGKANDDSQAENKPAKKMLSVNNTHLNKDTIPMNQADHNNVVFSENTPVNGPLSENLVISGTDSSFNTYSKNLDRLTDYPSSFQFIHGLKSPLIKIENTFGTTSFSWISICQKLGFPQISHKKYENIFAIHSIHTNLINHRYFSKIVLENETKRKLSILERYGNTNTEFEEFSDHLENYMREMKQIIQTEIKTTKMYQIKTLLTYLEDMKTKYTILKPLIYLYDNPSNVQNAQDKSLPSLLIKFLNSKIDDYHLNVRSHSLDCITDTLKRNEYIFLEVFLDDVDSYFLDLLENSETQEKVLNMYIEYRIYAVRLIQANLHSSPDCEKISENEIYPTDIATGKAVYDHPDPVFDIRSSGHYSSPPNNCTDEIIPQYMKYDHTKMQFAMYLTKNKNEVKSITDQWTYEQNLNQFYQNNVPTKTALDYRETPLDPSSCLQFNKIHTEEVKRDNNNKKAPFFTEDHSKRKKDENIVKTFAIPYITSKGFNKSEIKNISQILNKDIKYLNRKSIDNTLNTLKQIINSILESKDNKCYEAKLKNIAPSKNLQTFDLISQKLENLQYISIGHIFYDTNTIIKNINKKYGSGSWILRLAKKVDNLIKYKLNLAFGNTKKHRDSSE